MYEDNAVKELVASVPAGYGAVAVQFTHWTMYSDFRLYMVPAGIVLPDGKVLSSGEYVRYNYTDRSGDEVLHSFFQGNGNMLGWTELDFFTLVTRFA